MLSQCLIVLGKQRYDGMVRGEGTKVQGTEDKVLRNKGEASPE